jgi:uncharacterized protein (DUF4415 family)
MPRRKLESLAQDKQAAKSAERISSKRKIDFSDIPELSNTQLNRMRRVGRPPLGHDARQLIAIRIDPNVLKKIRKAALRAGKGYQTLINEILAKYTEKRKTA